MKLFQLKIRRIPDATLNNAYLKCLIKFKINSTRLKQISSLIKNNVFDINIMFHTRIYFK